MNGSPSSRYTTGHIATSNQHPHPSSLQLPFMSSFGGISGNITSNIDGLHPQNGMGNFQFGSEGSNGNNFSNILSIGSGESWRLPFLAGFEAPNNTNLFHYQSEGGVAPPASSMIENPHADPPVKVEETRGLNLSRQLLGISENANQQPWSGSNTWAEFSGVNTSSTPTTHFI